MSHKHKTPNNLTTEQAQQLLDNILLKGNRCPAASPLQKVQKDAFTMLKSLRLIHYLCVLGIVLLLLFPFLLSRPVLNISEPFINGNNTVIELDIGSFIPVKEIKAWLNNHPLDVLSTDTNTYQIKIEDSGTLSITVVSYNEQAYSASITVEPLVDKPKIVSSYEANDTIVINLENGTWPVSYSEIYAQTDSNKIIMPLSIDAAAQTVTFAYPTERMYIYIPDTKGFYIIGVLNIYEKNVPGSSDG